MPSSTEAASRAIDLHTAAERLHASVAAVDARELDLREAVQLIGRALGELAAMSEELCRDFTTGAGSQGSSELVRRSHELTSSLCAARRNAELVCRHLPRPSASSPPAAALAAAGE